MSNWLFLDTATRYTGYAIFDTLRDTFCLVRYGNVRLKTHDLNMYYSAFKVAQLWINSIEGIEDVVQEFPSFQGSARGIVAAQKGQTLQMARLCGMIEGLWDLNRRSTGMTFKNVTFNQWNGQVPKAVTCKRLLKHFRLQANPKSVDNNWADAIMLGYWHLSKDRKLRLFSDGMVERVDK